MLLNSWGKRSSPAGESEEKHSRQRYWLEQWNRDVERHAVFGYGEKFRLQGGHDEK